MKYIKLRLYSLCIFVVLTSCKFTDNSLQSDASPLCDRTAEGEFHKGTGSLSDPYIICTLQQFEKLRANQQFWGDSFELASNLDLSSLGSTTPIGSYDNASPSTAVPFTGKFDGKGYILQGFTSEAASATLASGLFGYTFGAVITDVTLRSFNIRGEIKVGSLVGFALDTNITDVRVESSFVRPRQGRTVANEMGGLVGLYQFSQVGTIYEMKRITIDATVEGNDRVGGLIGQCNTLAVGTQFIIEDITSTTAFVHSSSGNTVGGVIGYAPLTQASTQATFKNIFHTGNVLVSQGGGSWSGGIFGQLFVNGANSQLTVDNLSFSGQMSSIANFNVNGYIGSIIGNMSLNGANSTYNISRIASQGTVSFLTNAVGTNNCLGGLFGALTLSNNPTSTLSLTDSYFAGQFSTANTNNINGVGGIVGCLFGGGASSGTVNIARVYSKPTSAYGGATVSNSLAIIGRHVNVVTASYTNTYFNAPATLIGAGGRAEPTNSVNVDSLDSTQIFQQASFTGFDFTSIWQISEGLSSPRLR